MTNFKLIILLSFLVSALTMSSQIEEKKSEFLDSKIGEFKNGNRFAEVGFSVNKSDSLIYVLFQNEKYKSIVDVQGFQLKGGMTVLNQLYDIFLTGFEGEEGRNKEYTFGKYLVTIRTYKSNNVWIWTDNGYFSIQSKEEIDSLFGRE